MADVYILYSSKLNKYYIGSCLNFENRLKEHLYKEYENSSFTAKADDWVLDIRIEGLEYKQARLIEQHIKKMKSRKFIADLKVYPELIERLILKYKVE